MLQEGKIMIERKEPWNELFVDAREYTKSVNRPNPATLRIYDTTLRDGEQMPGVAMSPDQKYIIARELSALGVHILDLGFPAVSPSECRALELILKGKHKREIREDLEILVMCRSTESDINTTIQTIERLGFSPAEVTFLVFTSNSSLHCKYKLGPMLMKRAGLDVKDLASTPVEFFHETSKRLLCDTIRYVRGKGITTIEYGGEDASRTPVERVIDLALAGHQAGGTRFNFADTLGTLTPQATEYYCKSLAAILPPDIELANHFHNDFDLATINVITAVLNGFTTFSTTINGLGERAGNAPLHSVVVALKYLYGLEIPNFDYERLWHAKRLVEEITGVPVQANEAVIGHNVFSHESGIHTHGVSVFREMYEPFPYEEVGGEARFVYGKHSGGNILFDLLNAHSDEIGREIDESFVMAVLAEVKRRREAVIFGTSARNFVRNYYSSLDSLGLNEVQVLELAKGLASESRKRKAAH
jgi:isopropylmalate/homocitrate/citramalate synthase